MTSPLISKPSLTSSSGPRHDSTKRSRHLGASPGCRTNLLQRPNLPARKGPNPCCFVTDPSRNFNMFPHGFTSGRTGECQPGAAPCRRDDNAQRLAGVTTLGRWGKALEGQRPRGVRIRRPRSAARTLRSDIATARLKGCTQGCRSPALKRAARLPATCNGLN